MPLNFALYLPEEWTSNPKRLQEAGVPEGTTFKKKWQLALDLIDETSGWDIPQGVVVCDVAYGKVNEFRQGLLNRKLFYVAEIEAKTIVLDQPSAEKKRKGRLRGRRATGDPRTLPVKDFALALAAWKWKTIRWREGSKGHLVSRFSAMRVQPAHGYRSHDSLPSRQWLLAEWPHKEKEPTKFWFCSLPHQAGLRRLVRLAKIRWQVEQNYQQQKDELGLDHYEGRGYRGWHHHVTMNMVAYGFLLLERLRSKKNFWVDPAEDPPDDPASPGDLERDMSDMR
jgi:SRSO17 transposase